MGSENGNLQLHQIHAGLHHGVHDMQGRGEARVADHDVGHEQQVFLGASVAESSFEHGGIS